MELLEAFPRLLSWAVPIIILAIIILPQAIRILREYERAVIFRLGKLFGAKGPGVIFLLDRLSERKGAKNEEPNASARLPAVGGQSL